MIELRPFTLADAPRLIEWAVSEAFLLQWVGPTFHYPLAAEQIEKHLTEAKGDEPTILPFRVTDSRTGEMVGYLELCSIDRVNRSAVLGRVIVGPLDRRGTGVGTQMVREATRIGFEELGLHRLSLVVFDFNQAAIACYERVGYRKEGLLRECRRLGDEYWSLYVMSMLATEWRAGCPASPGSEINQCL